MTNVDWLSEVYDQLAASRPHAAMDILFEKIDDLYETQNIDGVDEILLNIDYERLDVNLMAGVLMLTFPAKNHLKYRAQTVEKIETILKERHPKRVHAIMRGLR